MRTASHPALPDAHPTRMRANTLTQAVHREQRRGGPAFRGRGGRGAAGSPAHDARYTHKRKAARRAEEGFKAGCECVA